MSNTKIKAGQFAGIVGHGTDGYFLMTNGDGTMAWAQASTGPSVTSITYPGDDTAADPAGGQTVVLTGTGFAASGMVVTIGGTTAPSVAHTSNTQLTITTPAKAAGDYDIVVTNSVTGASGTFVNGISYNGVPTWTTAAGSLGTFESETTISTITLQATEPDGGTITFNITNGALPSGLSLTGANIDGTTIAESSTTLYSFTIEAIDDENQATPRNFSITVNSATITPSQNFTINTYTGNGSTQSIEGKIGTAASFNGSSSYIDLGTSSREITSNKSQITVSSWVYLNSTSVQNFIIFTAESNNTNYGIYDYGNGNIYFQPDNSTDYNRGYISNSGLYSANQWFHVAMVFDGTATGNSNRLKAYINGNLLSLTYDGTIPSTTNTCNDNVWIGGRQSTKLNGKLDQIRFFNKALSSSEVTTLYGESNTSTTKSTTDIFNDGSGVALYEFEEGAKDTGGVSGYIGSGGIFNGSSSRIVLGSASNLVQTNFTFSAWVKTTSTSTDWIVGTDINPYYSKVGIRSEGNGTLRCQYGNYTSNENAFYSTFNTINDGNWHHVVYFINQTTAKLYIDGSLDTTHTVTVSHTTNGSLTLGTLYVTPNSAYSTSFWEGKIDQVRIFNKELSSSEVTTLYGETSASATKSTTDIFNDGSGIALYELEGNANDTGGTYNGTATNVSYAYNGTATNVNYLGMAFQPDFVWIKDRSTANGHILTDSVRGAGTSSNSKILNSNNAEAEGWASHIYGYLSSFDSNGFTVQTGTTGAHHTNYLNDNYVAWCWKAGGAAVSNTDGSITSQVSANQNAGFSIVSYVGTGNVATIGHGLSSAPEMVITKGRNSVTNWNVYHSGIGATKGILLNSTAAAVTSEYYWNNTAPTSSVFTAYTDGGSENTIAYCFHSVDGYQKVGSYSGSNSPISITTGFQPRFLMVKRTDTTGSWIIIDSVREIGAGADALFPDLASVESSSWNTSFNTNGFTISSNEAWISVSGGTYIYLAIA